MAKRRYGTEDEETSYWLSYSDMMAGLLLVFVLIITFTMLQSKAQYEEKEQQLAKQQEMMLEQQVKLEEQQAQMETQQAYIDEQKAIMSEQQEIMDAQQEQLDKIIGIRGELIQALKTEFAGTDLKVTVDEQTGAITFDSTVLFDYNKYDLKQEGKDFLVDFLPLYFGVLLKSEFRQYVSEIIIEGHTDTNGGYMGNLELSQQRALSVAKFCLSTSNGIITEEEVLELREIVTANGRSYSDPIIGIDGEVDMDASRRVEFKFRLSDEEMIMEMMDILNREE